VTAVAVAAAGVVVAGGLWWRAPQVGYRVEAATASSCSPGSAPGSSSGPGSSYPAVPSGGSSSERVRPGSDTALLPLAPMSAPSTTTVCRPALPHLVVRLDPARTARLAAVVDTPQGGWPDDPLLAKRVPPVNATTALRYPAGARTADCPPTLLALLRFDYPTGAPVPVWVSGGRLPGGDLCLVVDNGRVQWRVSPAVAGTLTAALDELPTG